MSTVLFLLFFFTTSAFAPPSYAFHIGRFFGASGMVSGRALSDVQPSDITYLFYNRENTEGTLVAYDEAQVLESKANFNPDLKTYFLIHGWIDDCRTGQLQVQTLEALLKYHDVNVVSVCWEKWSNGDYLSAAGSVKAVGQLVGDFILDATSNDRYSSSDITIVGHSLGAHVAGAAGSRTNGSLGYIVGLDPAGPLFFEDNPDGRLDPTDAQYVEAIHTNAGLSGVTFDVGHADFWPNGGSLQEGCFILLPVCSHMRVIDLYAESVGQEDGFVSQLCETYDDYNNGNCRDNSEALMGGFDLDTRIKGHYYLSTNSNSPYARGKQQSKVIANMK
ncbi:pancreatic triacylglycerol lipase-like [Cylas formicarius]|uniref:pancreatic triacylglycerol lipase-like n=1 Tax=Cylas formicarius TaxID=197179 RepID=UPI00295838C0|nr:pancreatic triacylglycerol lipase-like [Cylas formicarius]